MRLQDAQDGGISDDIIGLLGIALRVLSQREVSPDWPVTQKVVYALVNVTQHAWHIINPDIHLTRFHEVNH
jgi:hypothetical protein